MDESCWDARRVFYVLRRQVLYHDPDAGDNFCGDGQAVIFLSRPL